MAIFRVPTLDQQQAKIRRRILLGNPSGFSTAPGSVASDLFIVPLAVSDVQQMAISYLNFVAMSIPDVLALESDTVTLQLLATALETTTADVLSQLSAFLDNWGENFSETRKVAAKATGTVLFGRTQAPTQDITIAAGKQVKSSGGVQYTTTATVTMYAASAASYWNADLLLYTIEVPVEAADAGSAGNAPAPTITTIVSSVDGLPFVTNTNPITGGTDIETDADFGARLLLKWRAYGAVTQAGVELAARNSQGVVDAYVAKTGDPLSPRGLTDVFVEGEFLTQYTELFTAYNATDFPKAVVPTKHPVISLVSTSTGTAILRRDAGTILNGSVQAADRIQFTSPCSLDDPSPTPVQVTYIYDARVEQVQAVFNDPAHAPLNQTVPSTPSLAKDTPILVKRAEPKDCDYTASIMVLPGYSAVTVRQQVVANLTAASARYLLGEEVFLSDLNQIVEETPGVLRLTGTPAKFSPVGQVGTLSSITVPANQFVRLKNINIF